MFKPGTGGILPILARFHIWSGDTSKCCAARLNFDIPDALLAEVDLTWLIAGQGHRVDPNRFHTDPVYTMDLLQTGLRSDFPAVRECAAYLLERIESASTERRPLADDQGSRPPVTAARPVRQRTDAEPVPHAPYRW